MIDWKSLQIGDDVIYKVSEFDSITPLICAGIVTETYKDHVIIKTKDLTLWSDDSNAHLFLREAK